MAMTMSTPRSVQVRGTSKSPGAMRPRGANRIAELMRQVRRNPTLAFKRATATRESKVWQRTTGRPHGGARLTSGLAPLIPVGQKNVRTDRDEVQDRDGRVDHHARDRGDLPMAKATAYATAGPKAASTPVRRIVRSPRRREGAPVPSHKARWRVVSRRSPAAGFRKS